MGGYKVNVKDACNKEYRIRLYPIDEEYGEIEWVAEIPDLPGCIGSGDTEEEAIQMVKDAKIAWICHAIKENRNVPEPSKLFENDYSGKFTLRLPKSLHKELAIQAEEEGVSLNQLILYMISQKLQSNF